MNVLLLYPEVPDTFWSFQHALKFIHQRALLPPLGRRIVRRRTSIWTRR